MPETLPRLGCLPLMHRGLRLGQQRRVLLGLGIFVGALTACGFGVLPAAVALTAAAVLMILLNFLNLRETYEAIDWPVIVLLGGMIPVGVALRLGSNPDGFLMAVAVGASCAFLTPIGHQCNTLVLGPGGYRFSDYWRDGLPLEVLITAVAVPLVMWIWM